MLLLSLYDWLRGHLLEVAFALILLFLIPRVFQFSLQQWRLYWAFRRIPCTPDHRHFIFGHAPRIVSDTGASLDWFTELGVENKWKMMRLILGPGKDFLVALHPDVIRAVFKSHPKSDEAYYPFLPWLGRGLLTANGPRWARSRRLLTPAFHYDILRPYVKVYGEAVQEMVGLWSQVPEGESLNVFPYISHLTLDIMLRCACSHRSNCQLAKNQEPYIKAVHRLTDLTSKRIFTFYQYFDFIYFFTPDRWEYKRNCDIVHKFAMNIIQQRRRELQESKAIRNKTTKRKYLDFIDILLEAKDEAGVGLTDLEIRAEVDTFVFEGHDTTASGITWTLYNLALHPEHQQLCRKEVDDVFDQNGTIETADLKSLEYLKCCIKESMRLFPPVPANSRVLAEDMEIEGHMMPKGTTLGTSIYTVHRHPDFWENPNDFDPLRFTPERSKGRHSHAYVPFSAGPRNCIGQEFALNEEKVVLATILRNFELSLDETKPVLKEYLVILRPKDGLYLKLKRRVH